MTIKKLSDRALTQLAVELRTAHLKTNQAQAKFATRTDELNTKMDQQPNSYPNWLARRTFMVQDIERRDILDDYNFWLGEENRIAAIIVAEKALRDMGITN
jgi:hypothetical protein